MIRKIVHAFSILSLFLLSACSDDPSTLGTGLLEQDQLIITNISSVNDSLPQQSYSFKRIIQLGSTDRILLGQYDGVDAKIIVKYLMNLPSSFKDAIQKDSFKIESAKIVFLPRYTYGDTNAVFPTYAVQGHEITENWDFLKVRSDSIPAYNQSKDILTQKNAPDSLYTFLVDTAIVMQWIKNNYDTIAYKNYGMLLRMSVPSPKIMGFQAYSSSATTSNPRIEVRLKKIDGKVDTTITFYSFADVHTVEGAVPVLANDEIVVRAGVTVASRLYFDLTRLPKHIVINKATLTLTADTLKSQNGTIGKNAIDVFYITSLTGDSTVSIEVNSMGTLSYSKGVYTGDVTAIVTKLVGTANNGVLISANGQSEGTAKFFLKSSKAEYAKRPNLVISYSKLKL